MKQDTQGHGYCLKINAKGQHTQYKCKPALQYFMLDKPFTSHRFYISTSSTSDVKSMWIHFTGQPKKSASPLTLTQTTADPCVEIKNRSLIIIVSKKKLQLSRRTMFLWFYRAILPLLMLVSFNSENVVGLPIQTFKPSYKCLKERDTVEQMCGKCDQWGIFTRSHVASFAEATAKKRINVVDHGQDKQL